MAILLSGPWNKKKQPFCKPWSFHFFLYGLVKEELFKEQIWSFQTKTSPANQRPHPFLRNAAGHRDVECPRLWDTTPLPILPSTLRSHACDLESMSENRTKSNELINFHFKNKKQTTFSSLSLLQFSSNSYPLEELAERKLTEADLLSCGEEDRRRAPLRALRGGASGSEGNVLGASFSGAETAGGVDMVAGCLRFASLASA